jgi:hypothetical protein
LLSPIQIISQKQEEQPTVLTLSALTLRSAISKVLDSSLALARLSAHAGVDLDFAAKQLQAVDAVHSLAGLLGGFEVDKGIGRVSVGERIDAHADTSDVMAI